MKTVSYNPSALELEFVNALADLSGEIEKKLSSTRIVKIEKKASEDNPQLQFILQDKDGDQHEIIVKIIQRIDS